MNFYRFTRLFPVQEAKSKTSKIDENDTLLMDEYGNIRLNYDNPQVREKILNQLRLYRVPRLKKSTRFVHYAYTNDNSAFTPSLGGRRLRPSKVKPLFSLKSCPNTPK